MANRNALVDPITATDQSESPQLDKSQVQNGNIQEIDDNNRSSSEHKILHFHNCRIVDSFNTRTITMENCGNEIPQVTIYHRVSGNRESESDKSLPHAISSNGLRTSMDHPQNSVNLVILFSASLLVISCLMVFIVNLPHICDVGKWM